MLWTVTWSSPVVGFVHTIPVLYRTYTQQIEYIAVTFAYAESIPFDAAHTACARFSIPHDILTSQVTCIFGKWRIQTNGTIHSELLVKYISFFHFCKVTNYRTGQYICRKYIHSQTPTPSVTNVRYPSSKCCAQEEWFSTTLYCLLTLKTWLNWASSLVFGNEVVRMYSFKYIRLSNNAIRQTMQDTLPNRNIHIL